MKFIIDKLAKVSHAELDFDGITVIAGANNTGKSTVGKALYGMFAAFSGIDGRVREGRVSKCEELLSDFEERFTEDGLRCDTSELAEDFVSGKVSIEQLKETLADSWGSNLEEPDLDEWTSRFENVSSLSDEDIKCQEVLNALSDVFNSQCLSFYYPQTYPSFELEIKKKKLSAKITSKLPICSFGVNLKHTAFYIDNPETLVSISKSCNARRPYLGYMLSSGLNRTLIANASHGFISQTSDKAKAVNDLLIQTKFAPIEERLKQLMGGGLQFSRAQGLVFVADKFKDTPIKIQNLSQGIKAMALLQAAFMNGTVSEYDVLILDEPEIHLHPKWQIRYAEYIVLLQKAFNLTVLLTSHSPDFIEAIRLYTKKHGIAGRLNCYVSNVLENGAVTMNPMPENGWDDVFDSFGSSFDELMNLRLEVGEKSDEHD